MTESPLQRVELIEAGPPTQAKEWALRQGLSIAEHHIGREDFQAWASLGRDIAEALQQQHDMAEAMYRNRAP